MDDPKQPNEATGLPLQGPHWDSSDNLGAFPPMRLVLLPTGQAVELKRSEMLVGRHSESDLRLRLPDVSRRHCRFIFADEHWQVFDLHSLNGLFVNGERVKKACLNHGDKVRIGSFVFEIDMSAEGVKSAQDILGSIADALPNQSAEENVQQQRQAS